MLSQSMSAYSDVSVLFIPHIYQSHQKLNKTIQLPKLIVIPTNLEELDSTALHRVLIPPLMTLDNTEDEDEEC